MAKNKRASSVTFGFDFQVNAAIILMLDNVTDLKSLRLEGNHEDIQIELNNGEYILAQAKSVVNSSSDFRNVRRNLKNALVSLSAGSRGIAVKQLIFITNSPDPLKDDNSRFIFQGPPAYRDFTTLPPSSQAIIRQYLEKLDNPLDLDKFTVQTLPFETDNDNERYKYIMRAIDEFAGSLRLNISGLSRQLLYMWHWSVFINSSKSSANICLTKKDIMWPIMVIATDISRCDDEFLDRFEPGDYDEIVHYFRDTINSRCERYEFFVRVLADYSSYGTSAKPADRCMDFVDAKWQDYSDEFAIDGIDADTQEGLTKVVLYNIVRRRRDITKIKRGTNL